MKISVRGGTLFALLFPFPYLSLTLSLKSCDIRFLRNGRSFSHFIVFGPGTRSLDSPNMYKETALRHSDISFAFFSVEPENTHTRPHKKTKNTNTIKNKHNIRTDPGFVFISNCPRRHCSKQYQRIFLVFRHSSS